MFKSYQIVTHEFLAALYISIFAILKPITSGSDNSFIILSIVLLGCLAFYRKIRSIRSSKINYSRFIKTSVLCVCVLLLDYLLRPNKEIGFLIYSFLINGILTMFFLQGVRDYNLFTWWFVIFSIFSFVELCFDPIQGYKWTGNYMSFGFEVMLPCVTACVFALFKYRYYLLVFILPIIIAELCICANKGVLITGIVLFLLGITFIKNNCVVNLKSIVILIGLVSVLLIYFFDIIDYFIYIADRFGFESYSLQTIIGVIEGTNHSANTRTDIWEIALNEFYNSPMFGYGFGALKSHYDLYAHNFYLEILHAWGFFGLCCVVIFFIKIYKSFIIIVDIHYKMLFVIFFILWFVPTFVSLSFWNYNYFWCFVGLLIINDNNIRRLSD